MLYNNQQHITRSLLFLTVIVNELMSELLTAPFIPAPFMAVGADGFVPAHYTQHLIYPTIFLEEYLVLVWA